MHAWSPSPPRLEARVATRNTNQWALRLPTFGSITVRWPVMAEPPSRSSLFSFLLECFTSMRRTELLATLVLCLASAAVTAEVYKWVDEQGKVHYGDRPPARGTQADTLALPPTPSADAEVVERAFMRRRLLDAFEAERQEEQQTQAEAEAAQRELDRRCAHLEQQLVRFERANVVYTESENGERVYMSDDERARAVGKARDWIAEHCDR